MANIVNSKTTSPEGVIPEEAVYAGIDDVAYPTTTQQISTVRPYEYAEPLASLDYDNYDDEFDSDNEYTY